LITGYVVRTKEKTIQEIKDYHLQRLQKLSEDSLGVIPHLEEPTDDQKEWVLRKLKASVKNWDAFD
jgi:hypothetical protein